MKKLTVYQIDSFTKEKFRGNSAGVVINRPGIIDVNVKIENGKPVQVQIAGEAIVIFKTEIMI